MKYTKQLLNMVSELRADGNEVNMIGVGAETKGYYFEVSSVINIYKGHDLVKSVKTPSTALKFLTTIN